MGRNQSLGRSSVLRIGIVLAVVLGVAFLVLQQANFLVGRGMLIAFGAETDSTYRRAWFDWNGDIIAKDVVLHLGDGEDSQIRFAAVRVDTPGWFWFLRNTLDKRRKIAELERVHLTLEGLDTQAGIDPTLGDLGPIGALSASPFEAEGCAVDGLWTRGELGDMGLVAESTTLEFDYHVQASDLVTKIVLTTPGVSRTQFERREGLPKPVNALVLDTVPTMTRSERWEISDQGFVKARNAFCAKKDGIDEATFVARHVAAVQRLLQTRGLATDAATLAAYRDFAANGGQLAFGGDYTRPLHSTELYDARDDGSAMQRMNGVLEHGSQRVAVQWARFAPRPLPDDGESTWAAMQAEGGVAAPASGAASVPAVAGAGSTGSMAAPGAAPAATPPAGKPLASSLPGGKAYASSLPQPSQLAPPGSILAWADLPQYRGHVMQVWTMHNEPRTATLLAADGGELHVRARVGGGHAEYRIKREAFIRATLIQ